LFDQLEVCLFPQRKSSLCHKPGLNWFAVCQRENKAKFSFPVYPIIFTLPGPDNKLGSLTIVAASHIKSVSVSVHLVYIFLGVFKHACAMGFRRHKPL
jgi:hypothetical protein